MPTYTASHFTEGNHLFPCRITIDYDGVTLQVPGFLGGQEATIPFDAITSVDVDCPLVGYSTILITAGDAYIQAYGFHKQEVYEMKDLIVDSMY